MAILKTYPDNFGELLGKTLTSVEVNDYKTEVIFNVDDGSVYKMYHQQDCCEDVSLEDIAGDLIHLVNTPILMAEAVTSDDAPAIREYAPESYTWTFYKMATIKGSVTFRWFGESNGYYSEEANFKKIR